MGKRELMLIAVFVIAGALVYHATAPDPAPGERRFSWGQMVDHIRREIRGNRASAEATKSTRRPVGPVIAELKVNSRMGELTIIGEDRTDIEADLTVRSNGFDEAEAQRLAAETRLQIEEAGSRLVATVIYPREGSQRTVRLMFKVPARLQLMLEARGGPVNVTGVAGVEFTSSRGEARVRKVGAVTGSYGGGELLVADARSVKITTNGTEVELERISGGTTISIRSGELKGTELAGALEIDSQGTQVSIDRSEKISGVLKVKAVGGGLTVKGLQTDARIDARNAEIDIVAARAAPLGVYSEDGGSVEITPASGGYQLDARSAGGAINVSDASITTARTGDEQRASGAVNGGGPTITVRSARADITIRRP